MFAYYEGELKDFIEDALVSKGTLLKRVLFKASERLIDDLKSKGVIIDKSYCHTIDNSAVQHAIKNHSSPYEKLRGQIPISNQDLLLVPDILSGYETIATEKNRRGQDVIIYTKTMEDGVRIYVEEIRIGRHELAASTIYKRKRMTHRRK